jgi:primosomal protein N' (replication factor Y) (superfamily II helicase)
MSNDQTSTTLASYPLYAHVAVEGSIDQLLEYGVPVELASHLKLGMRVQFKIRGSMRTGAVVALMPTTSLNQILPLVEILSDSLLSEELLKLAHWIAHYYCAPLRKVLKFILPASIRNEVQPKEQLLIKSILSPRHLLEQCAALRSKHPAQAKILDALLQQPQGILLSELLDKTKVSKSPVDTLIKRNILEARKVSLESLLLQQEYFISEPKKLSEDQKLAWDRIVHSLDHHLFQTHLIHGVTGSGKTEIYLQAISHARKQGYGTLMLVPEIALTTQMVERFRSRFKEPVAVYHHRLSSGERQEMWKKIHQGSIQIVLGARSAVFLPIQNLKLIIVDEEHEASYKQSEEAPCYHARDVAIVRASLCQATVALGSATPSLESYHNAKKGKYILTTLASRVAQAHLPKITLVNMRVEREKSEGFTLFAPKLLDALAARLKVGEQSLLFLNRRGYHSLLLCSKCQEILQCPQCDRALTFHQNSNSLNCHYCDYRLSPPPKTCKVCGESSPLVYRGVGTEQIEACLRRIFPGVRTLRMDADTTRHKGSHQKLFKEFRSGKADVLIGTQMIAKGFHFPSVTLVGVLNSDHALHTGDFRAAEHLFQLLVQVAGRSGRGELPGEVFIQTLMPEHRLFQLIAEENYLKFYEEEILSRQLFAYPPFTHLAKLTFTGVSTDHTFDQATYYHSKLLSLLPPSYILLPVIPDKISKMKGRYRYYFMIKGPSLGPCAQIIKKLFYTHPLKGSIQALIDIDS